MPYLLPGKQPSAFGEVSPDVGARFILWTLHEENGEKNMSVRCAVLKHQTFPKLCMCVCHHLLDKWQKPYVETSARCPMLPRILADRGP